MIPLDGSTINSAPTCLPGNCVRVQIACSAAANNCPRYVGSYVLKLVN